MIDELRASHSYDEDVSENYNLGGPRARSRGSSVNL